MVAQELALLGGDRIERLVLACTSAGGPGGSSYPLIDLYELAEDERRQRHIELMDTRCAGDAELSKVFRASFPGTAISPGLRLQLEARGHHDTWDRLRFLQVPTMVAAGRYDGIAPLANSEALARHIPNAHLQVFEGGHPFMVQDARAVPTIARFLAT